MVLAPGESLTVDDLHTAGEPFRIVDLGPMEGDTVLDRRSWAMANLDDHRRFLVHEPRGHADMYGGMVVPPDDADGDVGVVFFHKDGFSTACGHGTIAMATWAIDTGLVEAPVDGEVAVVVDVPSGRLPTVARMVDGRVETDDGRGVGLMDVLTVGQSNYRCVLDDNGKLRYRSIPASAASSKMCRVTGKTTIRGAKTQLHLHDGPQLTRAATAS